MTRKLELDADLDGILIGKVVQSDGGSVGLTCSEESLASKTNSMSLSMPTERTKHGNKEAKAFLARLLPDSKAGSRPWPLGTE